MMPYAGRMTLLLLVLVAGCRSGAKTKPAPSEAAFRNPDGSAEAGAMRAALSSVQTDAVFSAPIAATRVGATLVVAGLVQTDGVVRAVGLKDGRPLWIADAIRGVAWTPNAELTIEPAGDGCAVLWRSGVGAAGPGKLALLGPNGESRGAPTDIRAPVCATATGLAWVEPTPQGGARIAAWAWAETAPHDLLSLTREQTPTLACGDHTVFVLADGDDAVTVTSFVPGDRAAHAPDVVIRDADFSDDERDHRAFTVGDTLVVVRVGEQGAIAMRDVAAGGGAGPWRKLKHGLSADDDIVALDGSAMTTLMVYAGNAEDACPGAESLAQRVKALAIDRASRAESVVELAAPDCARSLGPFWIAPGLASGSGALIAWTERRRQVDAKAPPISGLAYRRLDAARAVGDGGAHPGRVDVDTDALVAGGCDRGQCLAAALVRAPGQGDAMKPMAIMVLAYP